jgi:hypothetical protein
MPASLDAIIEQIALQKADGVDALGVEEIKVWTKKEVKRLLGRLSMKIWYIRQKGKPVEVNRLQYVAACKVLGIAESDVGMPIDLDGAKLAKKALIRFLHPDANGGDVSKVDRYQQVITAFDAIESYSKLFARKRRRPYKKRARSDAA